MNFDGPDGERIRVGNGRIYEVSWRGGLRKVMSGKVKCLFVLGNPRKCSCVCRCQGYLEIFGRNTTLK
jgi:hypothetical protein